MAFKYRKFLIFNLFWCALTLISYYSATINPTTFWPSELFALLIPAFQLIHLPILLFWWFRYRPMMIFSGFTLLFGYRFLFATVAPHFMAKAGDTDFKVLSYNVRTFNGFVSSRSLNPQESDSMINWVLNSNNDVLCLQEFYALPNSNVFNTVQRLKKAGYKHHYFSILRTFKWGNSVGMAIFSKHKILNSGLVYRREKSNNQIMWADIAYHGQKVRIYNAHFQSIFLKEEEFPGYENSEEAKRDIRSIVNKLKTAYLKRSEQVNLLLQHMKTTPHPTIICADLNDTPYSNAYLRLRDAADNSFERAGFGFGYTYNGFLPTLRIDHHFYTNGWRATKHTVRQDIKFSDHFPVEVSYQLSTDLLPTSAQ